MSHDEPPELFNEVNINELNYQQSPKQFLHNVKNSKQTLDVVLLDQVKGDHIQFQNQKAIINDNCVLLKGLLFEINKQGYNLTNCLISFYDPIQNMYDYVGKFPLNDNARAPMTSVIGGKIEIKFRLPKKSLVQILLKDQQQREDIDTNFCPQQQQINQKNRVKERKICEVVEKVALWRRFYTGFKDEQGNTINMQLEAAAKKVDISKKTLDDYLLQIRQGKKYGFDFNKNQNERIGKLRSFVKQFKDHKIQSLEGSEQRE